MDTDVITVTIAEPTTERATKKVARKQFEDRKAQVAALMGREASQIYTVCSC